MTKRPSYPTDLTDAEWRILEALVPVVKGPAADIQDRDCAKYVLEPVKENHRGELLIWVHKLGHGRGHQRI